MSAEHKFDVVDIRSNENLAYWAETFGVSTKDVRHAVRLVGPSPQRVQRYLRAAKANVDLGTDKGL